jgi:hypothetical protein
MGGGEGGEGGGLEAMDCERCFHVHKAQFIGDSLYEGSCPCLEKKQVGPRGG